jgi:hypothetical protein
VFINETQKEFKSQNPVLKEPSQPVRIDLRRGSQESVEGSQLNGPSTIDCSPISKNSLNANQLQGLLQKLVKMKTRQQENGESSYSLKGE